MSKIEGKIVIDSDELVNEIVNKVVQTLEPKLKAKFDDDIILTSKQLEKYLQVSEDWVSNRIRTNQIPYFKLGDLNRFKKSRIDKWIKEKELQPIPQLKLIKRVVRNGQ